MKPAVLILFLCAMMTARVACGQQNQKLSFNDNNGIPTSGTYNPNDTFSLDISLRFRGFNSLGISYWLEAQSALAPYISITNVTYFTFLDPNQSGPNPAPFNSTTGADAGYLSESRDLGATGNSNPPGTYLIATIQFTLNGAAPGRYLLKSTTISPRASEVSDTDFVAHNLPASTYKITIASTGTMTSVPEPTTFTLLSVAALGFGIAAYRRRRAAS